MRARLAERDARDESVRRSTAFVNRVPPPGVIGADVQDRVRVFDVSNQPKMFS